MLGSSSYEFNTTMECRDRDDDSIGGGGYNNINLLRNNRGKEFNFKLIATFHACQLVFSRILLSHFFFFLSGEK